MTDLRAQAVALEQAGDLPAALAAYERALTARPDDAELLADLGRLAGRMGMHAVAEAFYARLLVREPERLEAVDGLTRALRDQHRYTDAVAVIRPAIQAHPADARLWNTLGTVLHQQGDSVLAATFFEEAARLDPDLATARYNLGSARMDLGDLGAARADFDAALPLASTPHECAMIAFARATVRLAQGDLGEGWDAYEARLSPDLPAPTAFDIPGERWTPDIPLDGRRLLTVAEQGLGDEIMFAGVLPDVIAALGPEGRLALAVEPRLVTLFSRSFPGATVTPHATCREGYLAVRSAPHAEAADLWAPMGSLLRRFRRTLEAFPRSPYLVPDPLRVAHWRDVVQAHGAPALSVGLTWRSGSLVGERRRQYPGLEDWAPVLRTSGVRFVNLQYGAEPEELDALEQIAGAPILRPPGIDLKTDLDDLAALACAIKLVVAVPNATAALAAACGAETWFVGAPAAWPRLGTDGYPWYAHSRSFAAEAFGAFAPPLARVAEALKGRIGGGSR
ncbi:tetratricopeptide repeat protein [Caulobacter sp. S45]|uniref:tetratricopeptide repeat protein n=1 Tax=Caulobacter sp. S45 TaxID=1641861 RepID=UPI00131C2F1A|nr:tetratricopeptide repeat protein [Caulobacter sp. S45]